MWTQDHIPASRKKAIRRVIEEKFNIVNKEGKLVPFILNNVQADLLDKLTKRTDILKFRQGGVTSLIMAYFLVECMDPRQVCTCVMLAHDKDHTERLLRRAQDLINKMNPPLPKVRRMNDNEIVFEKTGSTFYIGTAGSRNFGRSATITHLHCSEVAFWKDPKSLMAGLLQAVPKGGIIIKESTGNGWGTWHHRQFMKAYHGESRFTGLFYPWYIFKEYRLKPPQPLELYEDHPYFGNEVELVEKFGLDQEQLYWRRVKIEDEMDYDLDLFKQEYPCTVEDAFRFTGGSLFPDVTLTKSSEWKMTFPRELGVRLHVLKPHPVKGYHYVLGADPSAGTGNDDSTIQVICCETLEQVARFSDNRINPVRFGKLIAEVGRMFNYAYVVCERNNHGHGTLAALIETGYPKPLIYKHKVPVCSGEVQYGWQNNTTTKPHVIGLLMRYLEQGLKLYDWMTVDALRAFSEDPETHKMGGENDDLVIALALACLGLNKRHLYSVEVQSEEVHPAPRRRFEISLDEMLRSIQRRKQTSQARVEWVM